MTQFSFTVETRKAVPISDNLTGKWDVNTDANTFTLTTLLLVWLNIDARIFSARKGMKRYYVESL